MASTRKPAAAAPRLGRKEQAALTKVRLKDATRTVLERVGYRQMRVADIAQEAGVAVGLFYHYYADIKTVTCEILSDFMAQMTDAAREVPRSDDLFATLCAQFEVLIGHFEQQPGLMRCMIQVSDEIPEFGEIWERSNQQWTRSFARYLSDSLGAERPSPDTMLLIAYCLGSISDGVLHERYVLRNPDLVPRIKSTKDLSQLMATLIYRAVFLSNPPPESLMGSARQLAGAAKPRKPAARKTA
jgi:AcrR family transcriptional regulator